MRWVLVVMLALTGCADIESYDGEAEDKAASERQDDSSLACDHFRNVASDGAQGLMTDEEMREKLKEVYDNSIIATADVRDAAREMLASSTSGDMTGLRRAAKDMDRACTASGN